jgi:alanine dehydrogenase
MEVPILEADQVQSHLSMEECISCMEELFSKESSSTLVQPRRVVTSLDPDSVVLTMPAFSEKLGLFGVKVVTEFKKNPEKYSLPVQGGLTILLDSKNSSVMALLDSPAITALRTGAVSGLATRILSREDSQKVGLIGSGQQAKTMLEAVFTVRKQLDSAKVYSRNPDNAKHFAAEMSTKLGVPVTAVSERRDALREADIVNVATNSSTPVLEWEEIQPGAHVNSVGTLPDRRELDLETVARSKLFVDTREGVLNEAGDVLHAIRAGRLTESAIHGDLFELVKGTVRTSSADEKHVTLFKSVGFGLQDLYACHRAYHNFLRSDHS